MINKQFNKMRNINIKCLNNNNNINSKFQFSKLYSLKKLSINNSTLFNKYKAKMYYIESLS